jgi:hypothetical protein
VAQGKTLLKDIHRFDHAKIQHQIRQSP